MGIAQSSNTKVTLEDLVDVTADEVTQARDFILRLRQNAAEETVECFRCFVKSSANDNQITRDGSAASTTDIDNAPAQDFAVKANESIATADAIHDIDSPQAAAASGSLLLSTLEVPSAEASLSAAGVATHPDTVPAAKTPTLATRQDAPVSAISVPETTKARPDPMVAQLQQSQLKPTITTATSPSIKAIDKLPPILQPFVDPKSVITIQQMVNHVRFMATDDKDYLVKNAFRELNTLSSCASADLYRTWPQTCHPLCLPSSV